MQSIKCNDCSRVSSANIGFRDRQFDSATVSEAIHLFHSHMSTRAVADALEARGIDADNTIYRRVERYSKIAGLLTASLTLAVGNRYSAGEVRVKVSGKKHCLFATMDDNARYRLAGELADSKGKHDADNIFRMTKDHAGKNPTVPISDKLPAYRKAARKISGSKAYHKADAGIRSKRPGPSGGSSCNYHPSNDKMKRINGRSATEKRPFAAWAWQIPMSLRA